MSMVIHDTKCTFWNQVSLNNTKSQIQIHWTGSFWEAGELFQVGLFGSTYTKSILSSILRLETWKTFHWMICFFFTQITPEKCSISPIALYGICKQWGHQETSLHLDGKRYWIVWKRMSLQVDGYWENTSYSFLYMVVHRGRSVQSVYKALS